MKKSLHKDSNYSQDSGQAGLPLYLRGPYSSMYVGRPWTIRQYSGFSTAEESNQFYKNNLQQGQKGLSVAFDLPTHRGYDSDNPLVSGDIGKAGVAIDSVEDMKILFHEIPLDQMSVSMTMNGAVIPIMAFYIIAAEEQGVGLHQLKGTIQNDILKEFLVRNTYIYPPGPSLRLISDIFSYCKVNMPKFNTISVSGYHMHEAGAPADLEIAYTIADGLEYLRTGINAGLKVDEFAPRISFFWGIGMDFFTEIAKMRAARYLWSETVKSFNPQNPHSLRLRTHSQTSGWSLTAQDPLNNLTRTFLEATAAVFGGTQSLHTNSYDEALALPSDFAAKLARDTQLILQNQTHITEAIDPWSGSRIIETKTKEIYQKARKHIQEIEELGGMAKAIEQGFPKMKIEEAAALRQAEIDQNKYKIVGVNILNERESYSTEVRSIDNNVVLESQKVKLKALKQNRNRHKLQDALDQLRNAAISNNDNILEKAVIAARCRATLGEISQVLEQVYGRFKATNQMVSNIYGNAMKKQINYQKAQKLCNEFEKKYGRRPRILIAKLGQDGHDRGSKIIASSFADIGFDVDLGPLFQTPRQAARQAAENDVHFLGISSLAGGHNSLVPETIKALQEQGTPDIKVILGGVIPEQDHKLLYDKGVFMIFGPGTNLVDAAKKILSPYLN